MNLPSAEVLTMWSRHAAIVHEERVQAHRRVCVGGVFCVYAHFPFFLLMPSVVVKQEVKPTTNTTSKLIKGVHHSPPRPPRTLYTQLGPGQTLRAGRGGLF